MSNDEFVFDEYTERLALAELREAIELDLLKMGLDRG